MFLTGSLMAKSNFFGSLLNRCRTQLGATMAVPAAGLKTLEEQVGLPPRPKKPLTPYLRFMVEQRPKLSKERPDLKHTEVVREVAKMWEIAEPNLKQKLETLYKKDQLAYLEQRTKYDAKVTPEQRAEMKKLREDRQLVRVRRENSRRYREMGRPKRPLNAFLRFLANERQSRPQSLVYTQWFRACADKWAKMPAAAKAPYEKDIEKDYEKYRQEMITWEQKMMQEGNADLVRGSVLLAQEVPKPKSLKPKAPAK